MSFSIFMLFSFLSLSHTIHSQQFISSNEISTPTAHSTNDDSSTLITFDQIDSFNLDPMKPNFDNNQNSVDTAEADSIEVGVIPGPHRIHFPFRYAPTQLQSRLNSYDVSQNHNPRTTAKAMRMPPTNVRLVPTVPLKQVDKRNSPRSRSPLRMSSPLRNSIVKITEQTAKLTGLLHKSQSKSNSPIQSHLITTRDSSPKRVNEPGIGIRHTEQIHSRNTHLLEQKENALLWMKSEWGLVPSPEMKHAQKVSMGGLNVAALSIGIVTHGAQMAISETLKTSSASQYAFCQSLNLDGGYKSMGKHDYKVLMASNNAKLDLCALYLLATAHRKVFFVWQTGRELPYVIYSSKVSELNTESQKLFIPLLVVNGEWFLMHASILSQKYDQLVSQTLSQVLELQSADDLSPTTPKQQSYNSFTEKSHGLSPSSPKASHNPLPRDDREGVELFPPERTIQRDFQGPSNHVSPDIVLKEDNDLAEKFGLRYVHAYGDGSCGWRSLAIVLGYPQREYETIKRRVIDWFRSENNYRSITSAVGNTALMSWEVNYPRDGDLQAAIKKLNDLRSRHGPHVNHEEVRKLISEIEAMENEKSSLLNAGIEDQKRWIEYLSGPSSFMDINVLPAVADLYKVNVLVWQKPHSTSEEQHKAEEDLHSKPQFVFHFHSNAHLNQRNYNLPIVHIRQLGGRSGHYDAFQAIPGLYNHQRIVNYLRENAYQ